MVHHVVSRYRRAHGPLSPRADGAGGGCGTCGRSSGGRDGTGGSHLQRAYEELGGDERPELVDALARGLCSLRPMKATDPEVRAELVETVRRFVAREVIPVASELEHADRYPEAIVEQMKQLGLFGVTIPEEYGGLGLDLLTYVGVVEELAYGWMSLSGVVNTHTIVAYLLVNHGSEEQKRRWLPRLATGELRGCLSLSEADAGSDTRNISCRAVRDGDEYVVNGTKFWVTNGERAGLVALAARTDEGISCLMVEKEPGPSSGGITVSRNIGKLGYKGIETVEMSYVDHRVPAAALLGDPGRGLSYVLGALEVGRINIAARSVGVARAAFDAALRYAQERHTFGRPIAQHQAIQMKLADMATKLEAARLLTRHAAERKQAGERADVEAGMAKLFASEAAFEIATESMRVHGGVGYSTELPVERYYRDAPLMIIGEGTNEIQRIVIARGLLARSERTDG
ncbi:MAG: acyl-CoA dehydrogenase [Acidimicrobiia bacterium]|nr:MAG: acyl-CoA dehydrogenase [Acidimicrobiia bacterium]